MSCIGHYDRMFPVGSLVRVGRDEVTVASADEHCRDQRHLDPERQVYGDGSAFRHDGPTGRIYVAYLNNRGNHSDIGAETLIISNPNGGLVT